MTLAAHIERAGRRPGEEDIQLSDEQPDFMDTISSHWLDINVEQGDGVDIDVHTPPAPTPPPQAALDRLQGHARTH